jgi:hypothetical protein
VADRQRNLLRWAVAAALCRATNDSSTTQRRVRPKSTTQIELGRMLMHAEGKDTVEEAIVAHEFKIEGWKPFAKGPSRS